MRFGRVLAFLLSIACSNDSWRCSVISGIGECVAQASGRRYGNAVGPTAEPSQQGVMPLGPSLGEIGNQGPQLGGFSSAPTAGPVEGAGPTSGEAEGSGPTAGEVGESEALDTGDGMDQGGQLCELLGAVLECVYADYGCSWQDSEFQATCVSSLQCVSSAAPACVDAYSTSLRPCFGVSGCEALGQCFSANGITQDDLQPNACESPAVGSCSSPVQPDCLDRGEPLPQRNDTAGSF